MSLGTLSFVCWGFFPIYWKFLQRLPAPEILAHRMIWSCVFYLLIFAFIGLRRGTLKSLLTQSARQWWLASLAAAVLSVNWGIYIYAVNSNQIVQGSLAYFINPLMNVAVGVFFFKERLSRTLQLALLFASVGVLVQALFAPAFPWIALSLALSFCAYGLIKKSLKISPELSSAMEGLTSLLPALIIAFFLRQESPLTVTESEWLLLMGSGIVTGLPLILFSAAAQKLPYSLLGMLQFIAPSLQFLIGILMFGEKLGASGAISFVLIWLGVGFYFWHLNQKAAGV